MAELDALLARIRDCRACPDLPLGPRPVIRARPQARLLIIGQAPGTRVHETGIPWNDASGDRLRDWLAMDRDTFYDDRRIAIMPMGLCYPGRDARGGDRPPQRQCAPLWHQAVRDLLPSVRLTLLVGAHAQRHYLGRRRAGTMAGTVARFADFLPDYFPLPHPSWRNTAWLRRHPWFAKTAIPALRRQVARVLDPLKEHAT